MFKKDYILAGIIFLAVFAVYFFTMPSGIYTGDSGEFASVIYTWGIAHPTGFPSYVILAKFFSYLLPMLEFAHRLNIFSAVISGATSAILFYVLRKLKISSWASLGATFSLAFGYTFWSHAETIQGYSLSVLCFVFAILLFLNYLESKKAGYLYWLALVSGVGAGTHLTFFLIGPFILVFGILKLFRKEISPTLKQLVLALFIFIIVTVLIYVYIPWRAMQSPIINWGDPSTKEKFIHYITQRDWSAKIANRSLNSWGMMLKEVWYLFIREFTWIGFIVIIFGAWLTVKKERIFFYSGLAVIVLNIILLGNYGNSEDMVILWRYFLPSYIIMAIFIGFALDKLVASSNKKYNLGILFLPAIIFTAHIGDINRHNNNFIEDSAITIMNEVSEGGMLIVSGDTMYGATTYGQIVLGYRPDIIIIEDNLYTFDWYREQKRKELKDKNFIFKDNLTDILKANEGKQIYSLSNSISFLKIGFDFLPNGLAYKIVSKNTDINLEELKMQNFSFWENFDIEFLKNKKLDNEYFSRETVLLYTTALNNFATYLVNGGEIEKGIDYFKKSLEIRENKVALYNLAGIYKALKDEKSSLDYSKRLELFFLLYKDT